MALSALNHPAGKAATVDRLCKRVRARLLAEPERDVWSSIVVAVLLTRP